MFDLHIISPHSTPPPPTILYNPKYGNFYGICSWHISQYSCEADLWKIRWVSDWLYYCSASAGLHNNLAYLPGKSAANGKSRSVYYPSNLCATFHWVPQVWQLGAHTYRNRQITHHYKLYFHWCSSVSRSCQHFQLLLLQLAVSVLLNMNLYCGILYHNQLFVFQLIKICLWVKFDKIT